MQFQRNLFCINGNYYTSIFGIRYIFRSRLFLAFYLRFRQKLDRIKHVSIVCASLSNGLGLVDLLLLHTAQWVLRSWVASSGALRTRNEVRPAPALHVASGRHSVSEALGVKSACGVVHVLSSSSPILTRTHQFSCPRRLSLSVSLVALFVYDCHPVEVILGQIQVLSCLVLHVVMVVVVRQLLYLEIWRPWFGCFSLLWATLMVVGECNFGMTYVWAYLILIVSRIYILWIITSCSPLSRSYASSLSLSLLPRTCPPACHTLCRRWLCPTLLGLCIEIFPSTRKCRQHILILMNLR